MDERVRALNRQPIRPGGRHVLYWCRWNRRVESNHALLYAAEMANRMNLPLVCFERLSCAYPTASDRFHTFVLEGVPEMQARLHKLGAGYIFQLPRRKTTSDARLRAVIGGAASVVTDDCLRSTPRIDVQLHAVDSSCIVPMSRIPERSYAAYSIRPKIHRLLPEFLLPVPAVELRVPCRETPAATACPSNSPRTDTSRPLAWSLSGVRASSGREWSKSLISRDRKSTRLNSSHLGISYAVFCLKK